MIIPRRSDALLIVDLQEDFLPGGALAVAGGDEVVELIGGVCRRFATVVATQDFHPPGHVSFASSHSGARPRDVITLPGERKQVLWPDHCIAGSRGARLHPALPDERLTLILRKGMRLEVDSYSAFHERPDASGRRSSTGLAAWLRARTIRRVFVAGLARDCCVDASAVDAAAEGFECVVLDDLTRAVDEGRRDETNERWERAGVRRTSSRAFFR